MLRCGFWDTSSPKFSVSPESASSRLTRFGFRSTSFELPVQVDSEDQSPLSPGAGYPDYKAAARNGTSGQDVDGELASGSAAACRTAWFRAPWQTGAGDGHCSNECVGPRTGGGVTGLVRCEHAPPLAPSLIDQSLQKFLEITGQHPALWRLAQNVL